MMLQLLSLILEKLSDVDAVSDVVFGSEELKPDATWNAMLFSVRMDI